MIGVLVASKAEFKVLLEIYNIQDEYLENYPFGEYYRTKFHNKDVVFYRSGSRKVNASASTQYMIDKFNLEKIIVLGTCSSSSDYLSYQDIFIPEGIIDYDFIIRDLNDNIKEDYIINLDLPKISLPFKTGFMGSSDRALVTWKDLTYLASQNIYASDMESAAVLKVCSLNNVECLVIKGVTDKPIKGENGYDEQLDVYKYNLSIVMKILIEDYLTEVI